MSSPQDMAAAIPTHPAQDGQAAPVTCPSGSAAGVNTQLPTLNRRSANVNLGGLTLNKAT